MVKIILILWTLGPEGHIDRLILDGFRDIGHCRDVAVSLTAPNPLDGWSPRQVARCQVVPK